MDTTEICTLVVAGGVGANTALRKALSHAGSNNGFAVHYPAVEYCTDNGAMIALAGALRLGASARPNRKHDFNVWPRWDLATA